VPLVYLILQKNERIPELIFVLRQEVEMYDLYQQRIAECDQQRQIRQVPG
jgi:hypothetical protein